MYFEVSGVAMVRRSRPGCSPRVCSGSFCGAALVAVGEQLIRRSGDQVGWAVGKIQKLADKAKNMRSSSYAAWLDAAVAPLIVMPPLPAAERPVAVNRSAAFVFTLSGACAPHHQASMLAAATLLLATKPVYEVVVMLMDACAEDQRLRERVSSLGVLPIVLPGKLNATCHGDSYRPDRAIARTTNANSSIGYYHATYAKLQAWDLVQYKALLSLDNDVAVLTNLDGVLDSMLRRHSEIREVRTPQGCLSQTDAMYFLNTGVWGVRPDRRIWHEMRAKLRAGRFKCHVGDQTVAMDHLPRDPRGRNSNGSLANLITTLHVGYNLKAGLGANACLKKLRTLSPEEFSKNGVLNGSVGSASGKLPLDMGAHVLHWSGSRKPWTIVPSTVRRRVKEPIERRALSAFMGEFCSWIDNSTSARFCSSSSNGAALYPIL